MRGQTTVCAALVYISALAPDETETSQSQQQKFPVMDIFSHIEVTDGRIWLKPDGIGCPPQAICPRRSRKPSWRPRPCPWPICFTQEGRWSVAWRSKPSWYIVATMDRTVHPDLERFVAKRMNANVFEANSSHVPMLSQPGFVLDVVRKGSLNQAAA